jgi:hypothetical protein
MRVNSSRVTIRLAWLNGLALAERSPCFTCFVALNAFPTAPMFGCASSLRGFSVPRRSGLITCSATEGFLDGRNESHGILVRADWKRLRAEDGSGPAFSGSFSLAFCARVRALANSLVMVTLPQATNRPFVPASRRSSPKTGHGDSLVMNTKRVLGNRLVL